MPSAPIRVVVADDQAAFRAGIVTLIASAPDMSVVGEAGDGPSAVEVALRVRPDVVLTDVRMPGASGIEITPALCSAGCRVLAISAFGLDGDVLDAIGAGADGYLVKTERPANILAAIRSVVQGDAALSNETTTAVLTALRQRVERTEPAPVPDSGDVHLTAREEQVLALVAAGLSNHQIAVDLHISETTVKTHLGNLFAKIGAVSRLQAALWHREHRVQ
ncbi:response regulator transcription factor [Corynebacterium sp.]|uniref:response regulator transcription factor n=1 Tax=Corynebacterium sp. TaxID=1720 RepID=UPI0028A90E7A|nr:response regulator transcription factor [Corynebacterium sp.]